MIRRPRREDKGSWGPKLTTAMMVLKQEGTLLPRARIKRGGSGAGKDNEAVNQLHIYITSILDLLLGLRYHSKMPQLNVYIDDKTLKKIESAARAGHSSISKWVKLRLTQSLKSSWPEGYFDLFGSLKGTRLKRPAQLKFGRNARRAKL